jgi:ATP-dependent Clp protease ATP-binding subunit ClpC
LRRLIRTELETQLARSMLANEINEGDSVTARWDDAQQKVVLARRKSAAAEKREPKAAASPKSDTSKGSRQRPAAAAE